MSAGNIEIDSTSALPYHTTFYSHKMLGNKDFRGLLPVVGVGGPSPERICLSKGKYYGLARLKEGGDGTPCFDFGGFFWNGTKPQDGFCGLIG